MCASLHSAPGRLVAGRFAELEDALVERVGEVRRGRPLAAVSVVVGSSHLRAYLNDLLVRRLGALANVRVVTLARFAAMLAAADEAQHRGLRHFGPVTGRPHFARALAETFADLREARVSPRSGWATAAASGGAAADGAGDLAELYLRYCEALSRAGVRDDAAQWAGAQARVEAVGLPCSVALYGFHDVNAAQAALLESLVAAGADLLVPVPGGDAAAAQISRDATAMPKPRVLPTTPPTCDRERVVAAWAPRVDAAARLGLCGDGSLEVVSVPDERAEVREAARIVLAALEAGAPAWDCAVVAPHDDAVERMVVGLSGVGLPVAAQVHDRSVGCRLLERLLACVAPVSGPAYSRRAVLDLLTAAPLRSLVCAPDELVCWRDEARTAGVVSGLEQWRERIARRRRDLERHLDQRAGPESVHGVGLAADPEASSTAPRLRRRAAALASLEKAVGALSAACGRLPQRAPWHRWVAALSAVVAELFEPHVAHLAGAIAAELGALEVLDEEVGVDEMAEVLGGLIAARRVPAGRMARDGVAVLTPVGARGLRFHTVVVTGLVEGEAPLRSRPDPILGDAGRRRVAEALGTHLPLSDERVLASETLLAFACESARERLALLSPRADAATGRPRLPSRLLLRLASVTAGHAVRLEHFLRGEPLRAVWRRVSGDPGTYDMQVDVHELDTAEVLASDRETAVAYLGALLGPEAAARRLGVWQAARSPAPDVWDGLLGVEARAALGARHPFDGEMHPTRLERYLDCPFAFLLRDLLDLEPPEEPETALDMEAREFGTLAHAVLEDVYAALVAEWPPPGGAAPLHQALTLLEERWAARCGEAEQRGVTGAPLAWLVRRATLLEDLDATVRSDPVFAAGDGRPVHVEWRFGEGHARPVALELDDGRRVRFAGRLDRVDATSRGARVIDYKTGSGRAERKRLKDGLCVQLPVYLLALRSVEEHHDQVTCAYRFVTRRGAYADLPLSADERAALVRLRRLVADIGRLLDGGMFPRSPRGRCDFCDVRYACGVSAWTRARKLRHERLADVVGVQHASAAKEHGDAAG